MDTPKAQKSTLRRLPVNVWVLTITSFLTDVSSEMLTNLIPLFLINVLGVRTSVVGLIDGVAETTASILKLYSGVLADRLGKSKTLTVIGYGISALAKPFLYFANGWIAVLVVRFSDRVGKGIRTSPRDALLAGSVSADRRGLAFGLHRAGDTAGAFVGISIATYIIWVTQAKAIELTELTFQRLVLASIIPAFLAVIILALGAREVATASKGITPPRLTWAGVDKRFKFFILAVILFTLGNSSDSFIILRGQERGLNVIQLMGMALTFNAVYALLSSPAGSLSDRIGRRALVLTGWLIYGIIYIGFALAHTGAQIWVLFAFYGIYYALTEGTTRALIADLIPAPQRGTAYGIFYASVGFAALPASIIAGVLWQGLAGWAGFGPSAPFLFGAFLSFLAGLVFMFFVR
jgi:MFS family permease